MTPSSYLWFIPLLPFAGFLINGTIGRRLPRALVATIALLFTAAPAYIVAQLSTVLFRDLLLPFEVTSILILVAILGAVVLARKEQ